MSELLFDKKAVTVAQEERRGEILSEITLLNEQIDELTSRRADLLTELENIEME